MTAPVVTAKRWLRALTGCVVVLVVVCGIGFLRLESVTSQLQRNSEQDCHTRKEGRDAVRTLVVLAVGNAPRSNPLVAKLQDSLLPGGDLEEIKC